GMGLVRAIEGVVASEELVIADDLRASGGVGEIRVEAHRGAAVGGKLGDGRANSRPLVLPQGERLVVEGAANVAGLERGIAEDALAQVGEIRRAAGAIPEVR